jgi:nitrite reductase/ring-hydroxylating ferredoxin subunit
MSDLQPSLKFICDSAAIIEADVGLRFNLDMGGSEPVACFAIRFNQQVYAYLNQCMHLPVELDWNHGEFFDKQARYLICATHGALYEPDTGYCVAGPCAGKYMRSLKVVEQDDKVYISL